MHFLHFDNHILFSLISMDERLLNLSKSGSKLQKKNILANPNMYNIMK